MDSDLQYSISTSMAFYLRHDTSMPHSKEGWVPISRLLEELNNDFNIDITTDDLNKIVKTMDKQRYQLDTDLIRALYGHNEKLEITINSKILSEPEQLYHGTPVRNVSSILSEGLTPQSRQNVHLTEDKKLAFETGNRHTHTPSEEVALLRIDPEGVENLGQPNDDIYVGDFVPPEYITECEQKIV